MKRTLVLALVVCSASVAAAKPGKPPQAPAPPPTSNFYIASAFAKDGAPYVGRFIPSGDTFDEGGAMQSTCSRFISTTFVESAGVTYDELFVANSSIAARLGVPFVADLSVGHQGGMHVRVKYELTGKLIATVTDSFGLSECCLRNANQCTERYIGEFVQGTGVMYYAQDRTQGARGKAVTPQGVSADLEMSRGYEWARAVEFTQPVYFAYRVTGMAAAPSAEQWKRTPPQSDAGEYFVGVSNPMPSRQAARDEAMLNARLQAVRWLGQQLQEGRLGQVVTTGDVQALTARLDDERTYTATAQALAQYVKDQSWDDEEQLTPKGAYYTAYVLAFLPSADADAAAGAVVSAVAAPK